MAHLLLDGSGAFAVTSHAAVLNVTDLDVRVRVAPDDWTDAVNPAFIGKWGTGTSRSWYLYLSSGGALSLRWSPDGTFGGSLLKASSALGLTDGTTHWVRATLDVDNGASQHEVKFYTADGALESPTAGDFSQFGSTQVTAGTTSIFAGTDNVTIGSAAGAVFLAGKVYRAQIYDGIAGTPVFDGDPSDTSTWDCPDKLFFTETANSATVTLQGDASLVGDCPSGNRMGGTGAIRKPPRY